VDYCYNLLDGAAPIGIGLRAYLPTAGDFRDPSFDYPIAAMATLNVGFSLYRMLFKGFSSPRPGRPATSAAD
jgi:hypothetical protein